MLGDLGVGFINPDNETYSQNPLYDKMVKYNARFIRGNHDNPNVCKKHSQWIKDGHIEMFGSLKVMFIGGAFSIDYNFRKEGYDWWRDEELSIEEFYNLHDLYCSEKPDIMLTHDCPDKISDILFIGDMRREKFKTRTGQALQSMLDCHRPNLWVFGHWHISKNEIINGTQFICLNELEVAGIF